MIRDVTRFWDSRRERRLDRAQVFRVMTRRERNLFDVGLRRTERKWKPNKGRWIKHWLTRESGHAG